MGLSGPPESNPTMPPARAECRRTLSQTCGPMPTHPLPPSSRNSRASPGAPRCQAFSEKQGFLRKSSFFQRFSSLDWYKDASGLSTRGGRGQCRHRPAGLGECPTALRACRGHRKNRFWWSRESPSDPKPRFRNFRQVNIF